MSSDALPPIQYQPKLLTQDSPAILAPGSKILDELGIPPQAQATLLAAGFGPAIDALFDGPDAPLVMEERGCESFPALGAGGPLPPDMVDLAQALVLAAPFESLALVAATLSCEADASTKASIATACARATNAAPGAVLGHEVERTMKRQVQTLLMQGFPLDVMRGWAPLLGYSNEVAADMLAEALKASSPSSSKSTNWSLGKLFFWALASDDFGMAAQVLQAMQIRDEPELARYEAAYSQGGPGAAGPTASSGSDVGTTDEHGNTQLHVAAAKGDIQAMRELLKDGAAVNAKNAEGKTPLLLATGRGSLQAVKTLLADSRTEVNAADNEGVSALHASIMCGRPDVIEELLRCERVDFTHCDGHGWTPLHTAAGGHPDVIAQLLRLRPQETRAAAAQPDKWGAKPFSVAAEWDMKPGVIQELYEMALAGGAAMPVPAPSATGDGDGTCWMVVGAGMQGFDMSRIPPSIFEAGVDLQALGKHGGDGTWKGFTGLDVQAGASLILACHGGWDELHQRYMLLFPDGESVPLVAIAKVCAEKGIRKFTGFGCYAERGVTGLMRSINLNPEWPRPIPLDFEYVQVGDKGLAVDVLVAQSIVHKLNDIAAIKRGGAGGSMERLGVVPLTKVVREAESDRVNDVRLEPPEDRGKLTRREARKILGNMLFKHAAFEELDKLKGLLEVADVNYKGYEGWTALHAAAASGQQAMDLLLEQEGIAVNAMNDAGQTALGLACQSGSKVAVEKLLARPEIDPNLARHTALPPLLAACESGRLDLAEMLLQHPRIDPGRKPAALPGEFGSLLEIDVSYSLSKEALALIRRYTDAHLAAQPTTADSRSN